MTTRGSAKMQDIAVFDAQLKLTQAQMIQGFMHGNTQINTSNAKLDACTGQFKDQLEALENRQECTSNARLRAKHAPLRA